MATRRHDPIDPSTASTPRHPRPDESPRPFTLELAATPGQRAAARALVAEYLRWVGDIAQTQHGLAFDIAAMLRADFADASPLQPPQGRLYLVQHAGAAVGVGALKRLNADVGELQRMYVQPHARGFGAGRALLQRLLDDARTMEWRAVRLESLKALEAAHALYRSAGFVEIHPYADNSMRGYQAASAIDAYRDNAVFMELALR
jgi:GNAT superfamily N-acetyltransferase